MLKSSIRTHSFGTFNSIPIILLWSTMLRIACRWIEAFAVVFMLLAYNEPMGPCYHRGLYSGGLKVE